MMINCRNVRNRTTVQASHYEGPGRGTSRELITGHLRGRRIPSRNMAAAVAFLRGRAAAVSVRQWPLQAAGRRRPSHWRADVAVTCQAGSGERVLVTSPQYLLVTARAVITTVRTHDRLGGEAATRCRQSLGNLSLRSRPFTCGVRT